MSVENGGDSSPSVPLGTVCIVPNGTMKAITILFSTDIKSLTGLTPKCHRTRIFLIFAMESVHLFLQ